MRQTDGRPGDGELGLVGGRKRWRARSCGCDGHLEGGRACVATCALAAFYMAVSNRWTGPLSGPEGHSVSRLRASARRLGRSPEIQGRHPRGGGTQCPLETPPSGPNPERRSLRLNGREFVSTLRRNIPGSVHARDLSAFYWPQDAMTFVGGAFGWPAMTLAGTAHVASCVVHSQAVEYVERRFDEEGTARFSINMEAKYWIRPT